MRTGYWNRQRCVERITSLAKKLGHTPSVAEAGMSHWVIQKFGPRYNDLVLAAGLEPNTQGRPPKDDEPTPGPKRDPMVRHEFKLHQRRMERKRAAEPKHVSPGNHHRDFRTAPTWHEREPDYLPSRDAIAVANEAIGRAA